MDRSASGQRGAALITVLMLLGLLMSMLLSYFVITQIELTTTRSSLDGLRGLYAAEAGLNLRAEKVREEFQGFTRPTGTSPDEASPCEGSNLGTGDFACQLDAIQSRSVFSYVHEPPGNPVVTVTPRGEPFQNLSVEEYQYIVKSHAHNAGGDPEALLELHFKSRLVPIFQFAAFYDKDLEIDASNDMLLEGPIHSNGDLYLASDDLLTIEGQITATGKVYHGRKHTSSCAGGDVEVFDPGDPAALPDCNSSRIEIIDPAPWDGNILTATESLVAPAVEQIDPVAGQPYWDRADARIVLDLSGAPAVQVRDVNGTPDAGFSAALNACGAVSETSDGLYDFREGHWVAMLEVDMLGLLDCIHTVSPIIGGKSLDDDTDGGLVLYLGVDGPNSATANNYGVRIANAGTLASSDVSAPEILGLTLVTDQALYLHGDYNAAGKKPAALLADSVTILSNGWDDAHSLEADVNDRVASDTTVHAALLAGTDISGGLEGTAGQDLGASNGGLENLPRLQEDWGEDDATLSWMGSLVSLGPSRHVDGAFSSAMSTAPQRVWLYDTDFNDPALLPPLTPRLVYLKQELFVRDYND